MTGRDLTGNPEIAQKKPVRNLSNIWGLGQVKDTTFGLSVSNATYCCKVAKSHFHHF